MYVSILCLYGIYIYIYMWTFHVCHVDTIYIYIYLHTFFDVFPTMVNWTIVPNCYLPPTKEFLHAHCHNFLSIFLIGEVYFLSPLTLTMVLWLALVGGVHGILVKSCLSRGFKWACVMSPFPLDCLPFTVRAPRPMSGCFLSLDSQRSRPTELAWWTHLAPYVLNTSAAELPPLCKRVNVVVSCCNFRVVNTTK